MSRSSTPSIDAPQKQVTRTSKSGFSGGPGQREGASPTAFAARRLIDQDAELPCLGRDRGGESLPVDAEAVIQGDDLVGDPVAGEDPSLPVDQDQARRNVVQCVEGDLPLDFEGAKVSIELDGPAQVGHQQPAQRVLLAPVLPRPLWPVDAEVGADHTLNADHPSQCRAGQEPWGFIQSL